MVFLSSPSPIYLKRHHLKIWMWVGVWIVFTFNGAYARGAEIIEPPKNTDQTTHAISHDNTTSEVVSGKDPVLNLPSQVPETRLDEYNARVPKTVIELQPFRKTISITVQRNTGQSGAATLINLNPRINTWFLLRILWDGSADEEVYHLENPLPSTQTLLLDPHFPGGISILADKKYQYYDLWSTPSGGELFRAVGSGKPYAPLCDRRIYLRNKTKGHKTTMEKTTDLLRNHVWQGEKITTFVREKFYQDAFLLTSKITEVDHPTAGAHPRPSGAPARPLMDPKYANQFITSQELGIDPDSETGEKVLIGRWYRVRDQPGMFVSLTQPNLVAVEVIESQKRYVNPLDEVEAGALVFMIAFDLDLFDLGFEMGTEHPRVDWSDRVPDNIRNNSLPGPDGIGTLEPLTMTGLLDPEKKPRIAATFIGGFKRFHGAFRWGDLALKNNGSHYGFIEHGVILSKLQPDLATIVVYDDGFIDLKTWKEQDNNDLFRIRHARQNGVPVIDFDEKTGRSKVGAFVPRWGQGNWSGSADEKFRTVRTGLGLQEYEGHRFLIYGYFSAATPSAMARIFQAYSCKYALLLDINALEHTYLAVYKHSGPELDVQHLIKGMSVLDKVKEGKVIPRFVENPDNRDFFFLLKKAGS